MGMKFETKTSSNIEWMPAEAGKECRYGFTTGSCAAAAAKAAAYMLLTGAEISSIQIDTPKGRIYNVKLLDCSHSKTKASCAVRKDGGDDPDITTGALIYAEVSFFSQSSTHNKAEILIEGGVGVGRVTRPGMDQPVGNAAINHVPREMISKEVLAVCHLMDFTGSLLVMISVPEGEQLAEKTFNPQLGIKGGISILGTSGIVEPMSSQALLDTIKVELRIRQAEGQTIVVVTPGNYGMEFMSSFYHYDSEQSVKCSNFIGNTIDMAVETGFQELLLIGHIGKLVKLSGGIMNTHSGEGDCRMELLAAHGIQAGITAETAKDILNCVNTEEALSLLLEAGKLNETMDKMMEKVCFHLEKRAGGRIRTACIIYANTLEKPVISKYAEELLSLITESIP